MCEQGDKGGRWYLKVILSGKGVAKLAGGRNKWCGGEVVRVTKGAEGQKVWKCRGRMAKGAVGD
jgi:hypothetical protein